MKVKEILDSIGKNIGRIKTVGIIFLIVLFVFSSIQSGCNKQKAEKLIERITGLNLVNDILLQANAELDTLLTAEIAKRKALEADYEVLSAVKDSISKVNKTLLYELKSIPEQLLDIPVDSSYEFLITVAYPYGGDKVYPFSEPQVKNIHKDYLENQEYKLITENLGEMMLNCEERNSVLTEMNQSYEKDQKVYIKKGKAYEEIISNTEEKSGLYEKQLDKCVKKCNFWKITTSVGIITAIILLI